MIVTAREFTSAAEVFANAALVRKRCYQPENARIQIAAPVFRKPIVSIEIEIPAKATEKPRWLLMPQMFEEHVIDYRRMLLSAEMDIDTVGKKTMAVIVTEVLEDFPGVTVAMLKGRIRKKSVVFARHTAIYAVRDQRPDLSFPAIGRWFGGMDHTSILFAVKKIEAMRRAGA